jgi:hypothetical protein
MSMDSPSGADALTDRSLQLMLNSFAAAGNACGIAAVLMCHQLHMHHCLTNARAQDDGALSPSADKEWAEALLKIQRRDPTIYDSSTHLFTRASPDPTAAEASGTGQKGQGKKTLRQVLYEQAVDEEGGQGEDDTELDRKARLREERTGTLAYDTEQRSLRSSLLRTVHGGGDGDGLEGDAEGGGDDADDGLLLKRRAAFVVPVQTLLWSSS